MVDNTHNTIEAFPLRNYLFIEREGQPEEDNSVTNRLKRLEDQYTESGTRRSVEAIMVVTVHGFPHVLVLQVANAFYKLPGGYLDPSESDAEGLITRLNEQLGVPVTTFKGKGEDDLPHTVWLAPEEGRDWEVRDCLSVWYRPHFDTFIYPYAPAHVSYPKECKKLYLVNLPPNKTFAVPANMKLHAIPVFEFYDNAARYGPQFAGIPYILSRFVMSQPEVCEEDEHKDYKAVVPNNL
ncbi:cleavage and polyadenylation specificity factor subunit 5 [Cryptococcus neoformans C23]|uniref:Cleavage and polyadenylation specificity factor subunit 5 n=1 Tax=Cryptococcus neoformans (strain H99 / ATCC 208821 / CBS 10515 / FGSC 9487) TaxID=235443 RepID=J9VTG7_CRYN9|nr:cleavage and polyadenylation specificity factor subunit 5 [Cryptococcus neoformans var. grubii H99]AUB26666.1 cleavage and polyadenylation specificity factor subunit 5 [Cryptococcus neoformans var. grubii]OWZ29808.1 cleavage and polyadenylation specificity factor subunit 5 [Cryptococcus neoformans var. grubii AD2-60a]OWZ41682.1 cleavage and polyadenylation specificity factor subunit 5 [Cryptococcus neoformans var. grubii C23]OXC83177.1 cleavage and polyadenylation specificity factor subunit |eukprot:XP_012050976.1 cleavage and polyadenylation specificity factor subunit 5 [Cryptococcus neoformans var. grubii H99]